MALHTVSICSGIGGLDRAISRVFPDSRCVLYVERELSAAAVLAARMEAGDLDQSPIWSDLASLTGPECRAYLREACPAGIDILCGGIPCFAAGTLVLTKDGYRPIESLSVGNRVLTHKGRWKRITSFMVRDDVALRRVAAQGIPGVITTDEHPFYAMSSGKAWDNNRRRYVRSFDRPRWTDASDLRCGEGGHYLSQVLPHESETGPFGTNERPLAFWWLVGRYLADGWRVDRTKRKPRGSGITHRPMSEEKRGKTIICCAKKEADFLKAKIEEAGFHPMPCEERTSVKFHIASKWLWEFLEPFKKYAHGKLLPGFAFELPKERAAALIEGYLSGDGHRERSDHRRATTVSKALALSIALLSQRAYGTVAGIRLCKMRPRTTIEGREVNQRDFYVVNVADRNRSAFVDDDGYGWKLIRKNEPCGRGRVFNISVEDDESYIADGAIVHNCQPHSVAGKRKGADDERDLWPVTLQAIEVYKPGLVIIENVPGILGYLSARIAPDLRRVGYDVPRPCLLEASAVGASQKRERLFILAVCGRDGGQERIDRIFGETTKPYSRSTDDPELRCGTMVQPGSGRGRKRKLGTRPDRGTATGGAGGILVDPIPVKRRRRPGNVVGASGGIEGEEDQRERCGDAVADHGEPVVQSDCSERRTHGSKNGTRPGGPGSPSGLSGDSMDATDDSGRQEQRPAIATGTKYDSVECTSRDLFGPFPPGPGFGLDRVVDKVREALESGEDGADARFLAELGEWAKWQRILERRPDLAPAVESGVRDLADGIPGDLDISRADQLRALGNGVVSDCAEAAISILLGRIQS